MSDYWWEQRVSAYQCPFCDKSLDQRGKCDCERWIDTMESPDVKMIVEPNMVMDLFSGKGLHVDKYAPWRLAVWTDLTEGRPSHTPARTQREARAAGGKRAEALGWTVAWERDPTRPRTLRARWVAPVWAA